MKHKIPGHFYSPVVNIEEVRADAARIWPESPTAVGIDFDDAGHRRLLSEVFPALVRDYDYPKTGPADGELRHFYDENNQFSHLDSRAAFCLVRHLRPRRIVEVGSGYSSLLFQDVNRRFLGGASQLTCIEPYPRPFLRDGSFDLIEKRVQEVPLEFFTSLEAGDLLFIDSSHVCKTGSDVEYLFLEVMPRLKPGVLIHVHDIFLPGNYPRGWIELHEVSWNEQYVLQGMLTNNRSYRVLFGSAYAARTCQALVDTVVGRRIPLGGSSLWLQRTPSRFLPNLWWRLTGRDRV